jgi:hypothetical protein
MQTLPLHTEENSAIHATLLNAEANCEQQCQADQELGKSAKLCLRTSLNNQNSATENSDQHM